MDNVNSNSTWWQACRPSTRRLIQLYSALLHNAHLKGFIDGEIYQGNAKYLCAPGFNCYSCPGAVGACPLGSLQNALVSSGHRAGWYVLGILMLFGVMLGRTICGWLCPLGLIQELLHIIPTLKIRKSRVTRALTWLKYVLLAVFVVALPLWYGVKHGTALPGFCKYICPAGTSEGAMGLLSNPNNSSLFGMLGVLFTRKFVIMLVIGLACIFCYRSFCRFLCPLGAIYGLFNRFCLVGVKVDAERCNGCGSCVRSCGMDVRHVGDHECINCARCMEVCPQKAISLKAGKLTLKAPEGGVPGEPENAPQKRKTAGRIAWGIALAVLCFALLWFNVLDPSLKPVSKPAPAAPAVSAAITENEAQLADTSSEESAEASSEQSPAPAEEPAAPAEKSYESSAPVGAEVGMQLEDFSITCLDGTEFHLADTRGKVTIINLWSTNCAPCVKELPHFEALYHEHEGDIALLAVHTSMVLDDVDEYVSGKGWQFPVAIDTDDDLIWGIVNGTSAMPQTIVLNRCGEVIFNQIGSVTAEMLEALYEQAAG